MGTTVRSIAAARVDSHMGAARAHVPAHVQAKDNSFADMLASIAPQDAKGGDAANDAGNQDVTADENTSQDTAPGRIAAGSKADDGKADAKDARAQDVADTDDAAHDVTDKTDDKATDPKKDSRDDAVADAAPDNVQPAQPQPPQPVMAALVAQAPQQTQNDGGSDAADTAADGLTGASARAQQPADPAGAPQGPQAGKDADKKTSTADSKAAADAKAAPVLPSAPQAAAGDQPTTPVEAAKAAAANARPADAKPADTGRIARSDTPANATPVDASAPAAPQPNPALIAASLPAHQTASTASVLATNAAATPQHLDVSQAQAPGMTPNMAALGVAIATRSLSGARQFDIRLDPPELGRVEVRLSIDSTGKASAHLSADQPQTLDLLQKDSSGLTRALRDAGLDVAQNGLNFSLRQGSGGSEGFGARGRAGRTLSATTRLNATVTSAAFAGASATAADGRLDIKV